MAKLPDNFVKPPLTSKISKPTAGKHARRSRKDDLEVTVHDVLVRLTPEQHQALTTACEALAAVGETVTIEDMIKQVIVRWMAATRAQLAAEPAIPARPPSEPILAQLRRLAEEPLQRWRELASQLRFWR